MDLRTQQEAPSKNWSPLGPTYPDWVAQVLYKCFINALTKMMAGSTPNCTWPELWRGLDFGGVSWVVT